MKSQFGLFEPRLLFADYSAAEWRSPTTVAQNPGYAGVSPSAVAVPVVVPPVPNQGWGGSVVADPNVSWLGTGTAPGPAHVVPSNWGGVQPGGGSCGIGSTLNISAAPFPTAPCSGTITIPLAPSAPVGPVMVPLGGGGGTTHVGGVSGQPVSTDQSVPSVRKYNFDRDCRIFGSEIFWKVFLD